ncbi:MAG: MerR family transcriptional regulator [Myxococcota bacterium]
MPLLKIGELAQQVGEPNSTIRYWTKEGLLQVAKFTPSGYHLYHSGMIQRCKRIQALQKKRHTLAEIKRQLNSRLKVPTRRSLYH